MLVSNSSSLIYLAKTRRLHLLKDLYGSIKIPPSVYDEVVVEGEKRGFEDALRVKEVIEKYLTIDRPEEELLEEVKKKADSLGLRLGKGEIEGIALCINTKDKIFLSDDEDAKELTGNYRIEGKGTIYVLVKSYKMCLLEKKKCIEVFEEMIDKGFWVSPEVRKLFYECLERIRK